MGLQNPAPAGGGGGFGLGPETNQFTSVSARNTYATANPTWLAEYDANPAFLVEVTVSGTSTRYRRNGSAWETVTNVIKGGKGDKGDAGDADEYFVLPASVAQTNSNKDVTLTIAGVTAYATGQEVIFHTKTGTNDTANARLQINALGFKKLLKEDGTEFEANELEPATQIRAIYDGTNFLSDFSRRSQIHYLDIADVARTGDAYSVTDTTIQGTGIGKPIIIALESEADNVGNVTLSVNTSTDYPVLLSDGTQMPAGAFAEGEVALCVFTTVGMVGWHAMNLRPVRSLKGKLVATCDITAGTHDESVAFPWAIESGITYLTTETLPADYFENLETDNAILRLPVTIGDRGSQLGWFLEIVNGTTVVYERFSAFGEYPFQRDLERTVTTSDDLEICINILGPNAIGIAYPLALVTFFGVFGGSETVASTDDYQVRLYLSEN